LTSSSSFDASSVYAESSSEDAMVSTIVAKPVAEWEDNGGSSELNNEEDPGPNLVHKKWYITLTIPLNYYCKRHPIMRCTIYLDEGSRERSIDQGA
jgi:hypothetical protein